MWHHFFQPGSSDRYLACHQTVRTPRLTDTSCRVSAGCPGLCSQECGSSLVQHSLPLSGLANTNCVGRSSLGFLTGTCATGPPEFLSVRGRQGRMAGGTSREHPLMARATASTFFYAALYFIRGVQALVPAHIEILGGLHGSSFSVSQPAVVSFFPKSANGTRASLKDKAKQRFKNGKKPNLEPGARRRLRSGIPQEERYGRPHPPAELPPPPPSIDRIDRHGM